MLKSSGWGLEKSKLPWKQCFIAVGVFSVELLACQVSMVCTGNGQDRSIYILGVILG